MDQKEEDVFNFTSSSSHRLPTVSAAQALQKQSYTRQLAISTGLPQLDNILQRRSPDDSSQLALHGGLSRGQVTEIYGPPGVGKTALAIQATASALHAGSSVVWIDTAQALVGSRLKHVLSHYRLPDDESLLSSPPVVRSESELLEDFHHFDIPSLPHLLALLFHPSPDFPSPNTSLIIIDAVSVLFALAFPRSIDGNNTRQNAKKQNEDAQWAMGRRWAVMSDFVSKLSKLAAISNIAVLLISQTMTKVKTDSGAVLRPALSSKAWDGGINTRIVLFRNFTPWTGENPSQSETMSGLRYATAVKLAGVSYDSLRDIVPFKIEKAGLKQFSVLPKIAVQTTVPAAPLVPSLKRKLDEIADSQSEGDDGFGSDEDFEWLIEESIAPDEVIEQVDHLLRDGSPAS